MADQVEILTVEGKRMLEEEYRHLIDVERKDVIEALSAARAQGDLSENADYDAARERQARVEARIQEIEHILNTAQVVEGDAKGSGIAIGNFVRFKDCASGEVCTVKVASSVEADPFAEIPVVSLNSALGVALIGSQKGERKVVQSVDPYEIEILFAGKDLPA